MLRRILAAAAFTSLMTVAAPVTQVLACSCIQMTPAMALAGADVAFVGVVAAIDDPGSGPVVGSGDMLRYVFAVEETLKGAPGVNLDVRSSRSSASCGQEFAAGQRWRVFANTDETGQLQSGLCSGNELLAEGVPVPSPTPAPLPAGLLVAIGGAVVVALISVLAFTRRGRSASA